MTRIFLAGATGVIGVRLVPLLVAAGHGVTGMTRSPGRAEALRAQGAEPVVCDVFDAAAVRDAMVAARPEVVIDELTDLPEDASLLPERREANARMWREGTHNLLAGARAAGAGRVLAQSIAWPAPGVEERERAVLEGGGVVLRYGQFSGPGTYHEAEPPAPPRIHVDAAARRTVEALDAPPGILTIVEE